MPVLLLGVGVLSPHGRDHSCALSDSYGVLVYSVLARTPYAEMRQLTTEVSSGMGGVREWRGNESQSHKQ